MNAALVIAVSLLLTSAVAGEELTETQQLWVNSFDAEKGGRYTKAREYMAGVVERGGDFYFANLRLGWLYYLEGNYEPALAHYRKAAGLAPGAITPLTGLVNCYRATKQAGAAVRAARAILEIDPMNYNANLALADTHFGSGNYASAAAYYQKLTAMYPEDLAVANGLAWCYLNQGLVRGAVTIFNDILVVSPNYAAARDGIDAARVQLASTTRR